jgi:RNA polymerase sigma-70 factor, ECF subfamily
VGAKHAPAPARTAGVAAVLALRADQSLNTGPSDVALVAAACAGDAAAFADLVTRYERPVYHLAYRTLRDAEEAKDITQESFLRAYRSLRSFRPTAKFSTWLFAIAYHACCDRLKRLRRFTDDELPEPADASPGPEHRVIALDEAQRLRDAIARLPEKYRTVITLYHLQGHQYEEIAKVLDLPMGTVKTHLFRAKEQLRRMLGDMERTR